MKNFILFYITFLPQQSDMIKDVVSDENKTDPASLVVFTQSAPPVSIRCPHK